jgi:hypothetical protein
MLASKVGWRSGMGQLVRGVAVVYFAGRAWMHVIIPREGKIKAWPNTHVAFAHRELLCLKTIVPIITALRVAGQSKRIYFFDIVKFAICAHRWSPRHGIAFPSVRQAQAILP